MASLKNIFENPLPDPISSWTQLLPKAATETSFDMFGEICHRVKPESSPYYPPPLLPLPSSSQPRLEMSSSWNCSTSDPDDNAFEIFGELCYKTKPMPMADSPMNKDGDTEEVEVLQSPKETDNDVDLCTEEVVHERMGDADDIAGNERAIGKGEHKKKVIFTRSFSASYSDVRSNCNNGLFPPPITSIGRHGKPRVYFKSYRQDGRFVLREIRIPTQRLLHSRRDDGRLRMQVVGPVEDVARREVEDDNEGGDE